VEILQLTVLISITHLETQEHLPLLLHLALMCLLLQAAAVVEDSLKAAVVVLVESLTKQVVH
jgi:hypothetical protein